jgi:hypothetical protein
VYGCPSSGKHESIEPQPAARHEERRLVVDLEEPFRDKD